MIEHTLDTEHSILTLRPKSALSKEDFGGIAKEIDPYIQTTGGLAGVIVDAESFPGWDNFGAMLAHFHFVKGHHKQIKKVAVVTDAALGAVAEKLGGHFISATIKRFPAGKTEIARQWIMEKVPAESV